MEWPAIVPELTVMDFDKSLDFYTRLLGFSVHNQRRDPDFAYLVMGRAHLMLEAWHADGWNIGKFDPPLGQGMNLQIECDDVESIRDRLSADGVTLYRGLTETWYNTGESLSGAREFLVQDPDGYLLRFSQYLGEKPIESD